MPSFSLTTARPLRNNYLHRQEPESITNSMAQVVLMGQAWGKPVSPGVVAPAHTVPTDSCQGPNITLPIAQRRRFFYHTVLLTGLAMFWEKMRKGILILNT